MLELETSRLRSEVLTDPLTELLNRRAFNQHLEHAVNQWERHHRPFVLILGDLDYFKLINDRFGHLVGDQVLKAVAQRIGASLRRSDLAFRIGGEEFAIILTESSLQRGRRGGREDPPAHRRTAGDPGIRPERLPHHELRPGRAGHAGRRGPVRPGGPGALPGQAQGPQPHRGPGPAE